MNVVRDEPQRLALLVAYDGTDFSGFARQKHARTVQGVLEDSLQLLLRSPVNTTAAGRTDAGVHASGQVVSLDVPGSTDPLWLLKRLNKLLSPEVVVRAASVVPATFDARFSATGREYEYRIYRGEVADPFRDRFMVHLTGPLSVTSMRAGAKLLVGEHDFSSFCRRSPGRSPVRRVRLIRIVTGTDAVTFHIAADSF
ncbi:MAG: tRNA pseudouridine(38-40) synthase TruA, partial [Actinobacteria bacterium]|nr:tRNA pseudouridine(38-40) synthase TruA [Actinomycetota bacterium]